MRSLRRSVFSILRQTRGQSVTLIVMRFQFSSVLHSSFDQNSFANVKTGILHVTVSSALHFSATHCAKLYSVNFSLIKYSAEAVESAMKFSLLLCQSVCV